MSAAMSLHLLKLCVGAESIQDLEDWLAERRAEAERLGEAYEQRHTTRMIPKRHAEIVAAGSLYWVIRGQIACRQRLVAVRPFTDTDGIGRCHLVLEAPVIPVENRPCRPFQGWRYLEHRDAPADLERAVGDLAVMPEAMRRELRQLGLI